MLERVRINSHLLIVAVNLFARGPIKNQQRTTVTELAFSYQAKIFHIC